DRRGRAVVPIYLPEKTQSSTDTLTPRQIVAELDKYVVGQSAAKRAVAIALRNRMRRQKLTPELAEEIAPKNILMIGPTGVGKTEIARRLARLAQSPFLKVEASKFTEVGYVGRDVESMVRDHRGLVGRGSRHQPEGHAARAVSGKDEAPQVEGAGGARVPAAGRRTEAHRHGQRREGGGRARRAGRYHLHRRDRQDRGTR